jgi:hypothetical protein
LKVAARRHFITIRDNDATKSHERRDIETIVGDFRGKGIRCSLQHPLLKASKQKGSGILEISKEGILGIHGRLHHRHIVEKRG